MRLVLALLVSAAALSTAAAPASAACPRSFQAPSVRTAGGVALAGPYVQSCGSTYCNPLVSTDSVEVPDVVFVGGAHVSRCN